MSSRERRLLDKDKEIRKLKGTVGHYFTCTINGAIENEKLKQELITTRKALDIAVDALKEINKNAFLTDYAQSVLDKALAKITALEQKE